MSKTNQCYASGERPVPAAHVIAETAAVAANAADPDTNSRPACAVDPLKHRCRAAKSAHTTANVNIHTSTSNALTAR